MATQPESSVGKWELVGIVFILPTVLIVLVISFLYIACQGIALVQSLSALRLDGRR